MNQFNLLYLDGSDKEVGEAEADKEVGEAEADKEVGEAEADKEVGEAEADKEIGEAEADKEENRRQHNFSLIIMSSVFKWSNHQMRYNGGCCFQFIRFRLKWICKRKILDKNRRVLSSLEVGSSSSFSDGCSEWFLNVVLDKEVKTVRL